MTNKSEDNKLLTEQLIKQLKNLKINLASEICEKLIEYILLLDKWNKVYNLTAIRDLNKMISHHLIDSLAIKEYMNGKNILDVGTGAGLPGIPLALAMPELNFTLLDSNGKKIRFLNNVKMLLKLDNVTIVQSRIEDLEVNKCFDTIITRATFSINAIIEKTHDLLCENGNWLLMKGKYPEAEIAEFHQFHPELNYIITKLNIAALAAERHLILIHT